MTGSGKRKATGPEAGEHTKRLYTLDASKNGSCSFCNASDHTMATCKQSQAQQAELLILDSQGLVNVPNQGTWNAGRYAEKLASQATSASPQQPPMQQAPPQQTMQQPNLEQLPQAGSRSNPCSNGSNNIEASKTRPHTSRTLEGQ